MASSTQLLTSSILNTLIGACTYLVGTLKTKLNGKESKTADGTAKGKRIDPQTINIIQKHGKRPKMIEENTLYQ